MAHGPHHHGESLRDYFMEQLLTILVVGLFGFVAVQMYMNNMIEYILAPQFQTPLLVGGIGVLIVVVFRAISVWREAGELNAEGHHHAHAHHTHTHDHAHHEHGPDCDHEHGPESDHDHHHDHDHAHAAHSHAPGADHQHTDDHGHSHDMAWTIARMMILFFPIGLFFLGLPSKALVEALAKDKERNGKELLFISPAELQTRAKDAKVLKETKGADGTIEQVLQPQTTPEPLILRIIRPNHPDELRVYVPEVVAKTGTVLSFNELTDASFDEAKRHSMEGQTAILEGRFRRLSDKDFTLFRMKMTCCSADTVQLKVRIMTPYALSGFNDFDWVQVKGRIQFLEVSMNGTTRHVPVIRVQDLTDIKRTEPKSEYE